MNLIIRKSIENNRMMANALLHQNLDIIETIAQIMLECLKNENTIFWCGNGGSAGQAQHLSAELVGGLTSHDRKPFRSISLTTDTSFITAWSNDTSYDSIFSRQVEGLGKAGDVLIGITTSGNSANVIQAFQKAKEIGVVTIALTGKTGGKIKDTADYTLAVPDTDTQRIQEGHILVGHILCEIVEKELS